MSGREIDDTNQSGPSCSHQSVAVTTSSINDYESMDDDSSSLDQKLESIPYSNENRSIDETDFTHIIYGTNHKTQPPLNHTAVQPPTSNDDSLTNTSGVLRRLIPKPNIDDKMMSSFPSLSSSSSINDDGGYNLGHGDTFTESDTGGVMLESGSVPTHTSTLNNPVISDHQKVHEMEDIEDELEDHRSGGVSLTQDLFFEQAGLESLPPPSREFVTGIMYSPDYYITGLPTEDLNDTNDQMNSESPEDQVLVDVETLTPGNSAVTLNDTPSEISDESDAEATPVTDSQSSSPEVGTIINSDSSMYDEPSMWDGDPEEISSYEDYPATEMLGDLELNELLPEDENNEEMDTDNNDFADLIEIVINNNFPISPSLPENVWYNEPDISRSFSEFCRNLYREYCSQPNSKVKISNRAIDVPSFYRPLEVTANDMEKGETDMQAIRWDLLEIDRAVARKARNEKYHNYTNLIGCNHPMKTRKLLPKNRNFFKFRRMDMTKEARYSHFQLRNLIGATSKNDVYYGSGTQVYRTDPCSRNQDLVLQFRNYPNLYPVRISTLAASNNIVVAGGYSGEYAMKALDAPTDSKHVEGIVTTDENGITNHIHTFPSRTSGGNPQAVFCSNDSMIRVLDCYRNQFVSQLGFGWAVNCSATSPDARLRVVVGDAKEVVIVDADKGDILHSLDGHIDYGFACAWSDDGHTIATGNQDLMVRIYDARNLSQAVTVLDVEMACVRSLRFSPNGGGPRVLAMAEPADMVSLVDAVSWNSRQHIDMFGEISGISFTPDGNEFYIANYDPHVGGLLEFERRGEGLCQSSSSSSSPYSSSAFTPSVTTATATSRMLTEASNTNESVSSHARGNRRGRGWGFHYSKLSGQLGGDLNYTSPACPSSLPSSANSTFSL